MPSGCVNSAYIRFWPGLCCQASVKPTFERVASATAIFETGTTGTTCSIMMQSLKTICFYSCNPRKLFKFLSYSRILARTTPGAVNSLAGPAGARAKICPTFRNGCFACENMRHARARGSVEQYPQKWDLTDKQWCNRSSATKRARGNCQRRE